MASVAHPLTQLNVLSFNAKIHPPLPPQPHPLARYHPYPLSCLAAIISTWRPHKPQGPLILQPSHRAKIKFCFHSCPPTPTPPPKHHTRWPSKRLILKGAAPHGDNSHQSRGACAVGGALTRSPAAPTELTVVIFPLTCNTTGPCFPEPPKCTWQSLFGTLRRPLISFTSLNKDSATNFKPNC